MSKRGKSFTAAILSLVLILSLLTPTLAADEKESFGSYKHVFIIGVDGAGRFFRDADTPNFDRIFGNGALKYTARTEVPTDSGPNWASILTGVSYFKHRIHNGSSGEVQRTSDTEYPSVFTYVRRAFPDAELGSFVNWNNVNYGIIETDIGVTEKQNGNDSALTDEICEYFDSGNAPALFFVQLDSVDHAGHEYGSDSDEYMQAISTADGYVGRIYDAAVRNGMMEDGLFIVVADHGHKPDGGHGRFSMRETNTTVAVAGRTVVSGGGLDSDTRDRDVAAIALYALGIERPGDMTARIPSDLFTDVRGEIRPFHKDILDTFISAVMWPVTLVTAIGDLF